MMLDDCVKVGSPVYKPENMPSLLAMIAYGVKENRDQIVCKWLMDYTAKATSYIAAQKQNYINMMNIFQKGQVA